jgi:hypothetical protein
MTRIPSLTSIPTMIKKRNEIRISNGTWTPIVNRIPNEIRTPNLK